MNNASISGNPKDNKHSNDSLFQKRPILITVFCILYLFSFIWQFVELIVPSGYATAIIKLPGWFVLSQLMIFYPVGIMSILGIWFMRRWGLYIYCLLTLLVWALMLFELHLLPHLEAFLLAIGFCVVGFIYIKRMR